nr:TlpA disulfide reductase family protein [uncultured Flavobacterium sp.]
MINGNVEGDVEGKYIYLKSNIPNTLQLVTKDSTLVKNGVFSFVIDPSELAIHYLQFGKNERVLPFISEKGTLTIKYNSLDSKLNSLSGTFNNDKYQEYASQANNLLAKINAFEKQNAQKLIKAQKENNTTLLNAINLENQKLKQQYQNYNKEFVEANKTAYVSLILLEQLTKKGDYTFDEAKAIFNQFSADIVNSPFGKQLDAFYNPENTVADTSIGAKFPDYVGNDMQGNPTSIYTKLGKVTLIDFWASWCPPCRIENPNLVKLYADYKDKGLEIIGISLDKSKNNWEKAVVKDKITWIQLSNLKEWKDPIVKKIGIEEIPTTFLLDEQGKIIAKDLKTADLRKKIDELLK